MLAKKKRGQPIEGLQGLAMIDHSTGRANPLGVGAT